MKNFDKLRGHALNVAVATELGWKQLSETTWQKPQSWRYVIKLDGDKQNYAMAFDPAHDIADAWTLTLERCEWSFDEYTPSDDSPYVRNGIRELVLWAQAYHKVDAKTMFEARVFFSDFQSNGAAYATARCVAWLKARAAERRAE